MVDVLSANAVGMVVSAFIGGLVAILYCAWLWQQAKRLTRKKPMWVSIAGGFLLRFAFIVGVFYWLFELGGNLWLLSGLFSFMVLRWLVARSVASQAVSRVKQLEEPRA